MFGEIRRWPPSPLTKLPYYRSTDVCLIIPTTWHFMNTYMHFLVSACLFSMHPDCPSIYWLLGRWRDAQKYKSISVNVAHGLSNCARARKKKRLHQQLDDLLELLNHISPIVSHRNTLVKYHWWVTRNMMEKTRSAATAKVWLRQEMWPGFIQPGLEVSFKLG